jgi:CRP-like cAMP-binding protein
MLSSNRRPGQPVTLGAGCCFGEAALVASLPRLEAATAKTSCVVLVQPREQAARPL